MRFPLDSYGNPISIQWGPNRVLIEKTALWFLWGANLLLVGCQRVYSWIHFWNSKLDVNGTPRIFLWDANGGPACFQHFAAVGFQWGARWIRMGLQWDATCVLVWFRWDSCVIRFGFQWDHGLGFQLDFKCDCSGIPNRLNSSWNPMRSTLDSNRSPFGCDLDYGVILIWCPTDSNLIRILVQYWMSVGSAFDSGGSHNFFIILSWVGANTTPNWITIWCHCDSISIPKMIPFGFK